jgi:hypothetical protein
VHGRDSSGDNVESTFDGKELVAAFDEGGQFTGEMMDYVISNWKADPSRNHVFESGSRVLLSPYFLSVNLLMLTCLILFLSFIFCFNYLCYNLHFLFAVRSRYG